MKEEKKEIKLRIIGINEISYKQIQPPIPVDEIVLGENLVFGLGFSFEVNVKDEIFKQKTKINFLLKKFDEPIIELETELIFHVINLKNVVKEIEGKEMKIDDNFLATLTGVSIGTSRGILAKNTKGSEMSKFPLPILNPNDILKDLKKNDAQNK